MEFLCFHVPRHVSANTAWQGTFRMNVKEINPGSSATLLHLAAIFIPLTVITV